MFKLGRTKAERQEVFENIVDIYTNKNLSLEDIAQQYEVSKQAISQFLIKRGFIPKKEEDIKKLHIKNKVNNELIEEKLNYYKRKRNSYVWTEYTLKQRVKELEDKLNKIKGICITANDIGLGKITDYFYKIREICEV